MSVVLFEEDTPIDLMCRGFGQEYILDETGFDIGYHGSKLKREAKGVDRLAYKAEHLVQRVGESCVLSMLDDYAVGKLSIDEALAVVGLAGPNISKFVKIFPLTPWNDDFRDADRRRRRAQMKNGFAAQNGGVDNPFKLKEYQDRAAKTREEKYGGAYTFSSGSSKADEARTTFREHMKDDEFRDGVVAKRKSTVMERYGVDNPMHSEAIKQKVRDTNRERYGCDSWAQTEEAREAQSERMRATVHSRNRIARDTCLERYGVEYYSQLPDARSAQSERMHETLSERFDKMHVTMQERYGCDWGGQTDRHREKMRLAWSEHGDEILEKIRLGNMAKYGVPYYAQTSEARQAQSERMKLDGYRRAKVARDTFFERYGFDHWMKDSENARRVHDIIIKNGKGLFSVVELFVFDLLSDFFGADDVVFQYSEDVRYPFACDFYVKSRDLFIELNGTWTHGGHWYNFDSELDTLVATEWRNKNTPYYDCALSTWCERDVLKRKIAREHNLNYVVLWDGSSAVYDAHLWIAMGCPDGKDWLKEYSWLPDRTVSVDFAWPKKVVLSNRFATSVAMAANGGLFYKHEIDAWNDNGYLSSWGTLQAKLYSNRLRYEHSTTSGEWTGSLPDELSDMDIVRGLNISGLIRGYSHFNNEAMVEFCSKYGVQSLYDPCAGWGERLVTCGVQGISYFGCDIRPELVDGYMSIVEHYDFDDCEFVVNDAAQNDVRDRKHDSVFTCPPYGGIEIYSEFGSENLEDDLFAAWWKKVCEMSIGANTKYFAVQTNQAYRSVFTEGIENQGFHFVDELLINGGSRPYNRSKKEYECVLVFERS